MFVLSMFEYSSMAEAYKEGKQEVEFVSIYANI